MDLNPETEALLVDALHAAPTLLENLYWGWLLGLSSANDYLSELAITSLVGPGYLPDDFPGEP